MNKGREDHVSKYHDQFISSAASFIAMFKIQLFSRPQKKKKQQQQLHHHKEKREEVLLAATCLCAPAIALHPSTTTFAVHRTSSQSARDRNRSGTQRSRQL
jgi:hypothetical protein